MRIIAECETVLQMIVVAFLSHGVSVGYVQDYRFAAERWRSLNESFRGPLIVVVTDLPTPGDKPLLER